MGQIPMSSGQNETCSKMYVTCNNQCDDDRRQKMESVVVNIELRRPGCVVGTCVNHALSLCTAVFGRTMLQRTRTLYDARRTRTLRRHLLLTCLYLLCFKDTVEFSTARTIPTYTAP